MIRVTLTSTMGSGDESYTCVLKSNSVAQIDDYYTGNWSQSGNSLQINWKLNTSSDCTYKLTGTLSGNTYNGTYTHYDGSKLYDQGTFSGSKQ
jgi:hypothetical protein